MGVCENVFCAGRSPRCHQTMRTSQKRLQLVFTNWFRFQMVVRKSHRRGQRLPTFFNRPRTSLSRTILPRSTTYANARGIDSTSRSTMSLPVSRSCCRIWPLLLLGLGTLTTSGDHYIRLVHSHCSTSLGRRISWLVRLLLLFSVVV